MCSTFKAKKVRRTSFALCGQLKCTKRAGIKFGRTWEMQVIARRSQRVYLSTCTPAVSKRYQVLLAQPAGLQSYTYYWSSQQKGILKYLIPHKSTTARELQVLLYKVFILERYQIFEMASTIKRHHSQCSGLHLSFPLFKLQPPVPLQHTSAWPAICLPKNLPHP